MADEEEALEHRLERISRNLSEAASELQGLVALLRVRLGEDQRDMKRAYGRLTDRDKTEGGSDARREH